MASNRETARDGLAALLTTALASLVQTVYHYRVGNFEGASPVVVVSSGGSLRRRATLQGGRATVYLQVDVFVLYSDEGTWGEDEAEDRIDAIESAIAGVVDANQATDDWYALSFSERSQRLDVEVGGLEYIREVITLAAEVWG